MGWVRAAINKEPAMVLAGVLGIGSIAIPYVVVPIRRRLGLPTYQWDANPETHPYISFFGEQYKKFEFNNAELLAKWSQHGPYRYNEKLQPKSYSERDFPEARERLKEKGLL